jgi:hypothetical protein
MGGAVGDEVVVDYLGEQRVATVLWRYAESGRERALIRFETPAGLVVRQMRWVDELEPSGRVLLIGLRWLGTQDLPEEG